MNFIESSGGICFLDKNYQNHWLQISQKSDNLEFTLILAQERRKFQEPIKIDVLIGLLSTDKEVADILLSSSHRSIKLVYLERSQPIWAIISHSI